MVTAALRAVVLPHASIERSRCGIIVLQFFNTPLYSFLPNKFPKFSLFGLLLTRPLFAHKAAETRSHRLRGHRCEDVWTHLFRVMSFSSERLLSKRTSGLWMEGFERVLICCTMWLATYARLVGHVVLIFHKLNVK